MTMVDGAAGAATTRRADDVPSTSAVPCAARPGSGLVHLGRPCQCFFGGPPPEFLDDAARHPELRTL